MTKCAKFEKCNSKFNKQFDIVWNDEHHLPFEKCEETIALQDSGGYGQDCDFQYMNFPLNLLDINSINWTFVTFNRNGYMCQK